MTQVERIKRFNEKVIVTPGCWSWKGWLSNRGYAGFKSEFGQSAHRFSYSFYIGPIPPGMIVCHKCDNPICSNPSHLFLGTHQDNASDKVAKGRHPRNEESVLAKLSNEQVLQIRSLYARGKKGFGCKSLAKKFACSQSNIFHIVNNKTRNLSSGGPG